MKSAHCLNIGVVKAVYTTYGSWRQWAGQFWVEFYHDCLHRRRHFHFLLPQENNRLPFPEWALPSGSGTMPSVRSIVFVRPFSPIIKRDSAWALPLIKKLLRSDQFFPITLLKMSSPISRSSSSTSAVLYYVLLLCVLMINLSSTCHGFKVNWRAKIFRKYKKLNLQ